MKTLGLVADYAFASD